ncbi:MAG: four helix bundle protein [Bacteroidetes bacterium]|nr:four helix bundle protein [Bacteroidota bacterium]
MTEMLEKLRFYQKAKELYSASWKDSEILMKDFRGKEVAKQLTRSVGSICANIEEGCGRGFGKEYPQFLRIARGSAKESLGWYERSKFLISIDTVSQRIKTLEEIIGALSKSIYTLENRKRK